ncbi:MAG: RluA family pseudouridine synthase [Paludibaculum sp.]
MHRLDKGTSGVMLVARTDAAHRNLATQFAGRKVKKVYLALVMGHVKQDAGRIDTAITRDPVNRDQDDGPAGRRARGPHRVFCAGAAETPHAAAVLIGTGRTHQNSGPILSQLGHPVAGDPLYGAPAAPENRPWLHAWRITFTSPATGEEVTIEAPLPEELVAWKERLL